MTTNRRTVTIANVRAEDIIPTDTIHIEDRWRDILSIYATEAQFIDEFGKTPTDGSGHIGHLNRYPGVFTMHMSEATHNGVLARAFDLGYVVIRIAYHETSDGSRLDDRFIVAHPHDLIKTQILAS